MRTKWLEIGLALASGFFAAVGAPIAPQVASGPEVVEVEVQKTLSDGLMRDGSGGYNPPEGLFSISLKTSAGVREHIVSAPVYGPGELALTYLKPVIPLDRGATIVPVPVPAANIRFKVVPHEGSSTFEANVTKESLMQRLSGSMSLSGAELDEMNDLLEVTIQPVSTTQSEQASAERREHVSFESPSQASGPVRRVAHHPGYVSFSF